MNARLAVFQAVDPQAVSVEVDLRPTQVNEFGDAQTVPEGDQDHQLVTLTGGVFDDFLVGFGEIVSLQEPGGTLLRLLIPPL
jgi:hypothetical protein